MNNNFVKIIYSINPNIESIINYVNNYPNSKIIIYVNLKKNLICRDELNNYISNNDLKKNLIIEYYNDNFIINYKEENDIDIFDLNYYEYTYIIDKIDINRIKLLINSKGILFDNRKSNLIMFCVYHKTYHIRNDTFYFKF